MVMASVTLKENYWKNFQIQNDDIEFLYNLLLEGETPLTTEEMVFALIQYRINHEKAEAESRQSSLGEIYRPQNSYSINQEITFQSMGWKKGKVSAIRPANNPDMPPFDVIVVDFEADGQHQFAANLQDHILNQVSHVVEENPLFDPAYINENFAQNISTVLENAFIEKEDIVRIAGKWFPRSLLVDISLGYLNLAEAVLDMKSGGPLSTSELIEQIELPTDVNQNLTEFSMNLALQEDQRFDEVGPAGKVLWFLNRLEPAEVLNPPIFLKFQNGNYERNLFLPEMLELEAQLDDEFAISTSSPSLSQEIAICLNFPHWRSGTIPLTNKVANLFPTAYEAPRIQLTLVDAETQERISGWVVRPHKYVYGLKEWYLAQGTIPGSYLYMRKGKNPGEIIIRVDKKRPTREWLRTVLVGTDGGVVFALLKQNISTTYDERMAFVIPDLEAIDSVWRATGKKQSLPEIVNSVTLELSKLNPQGHVHVQELYAGINTVRRCSPAALFDILVTNPKYQHLGDLYYHLADTR